jgi:hypothetical protein
LRPPAQEDFREGYTQALHHCLPEPFEIFPESKIRLRDASRILNLQIPEFRSEDREAHGHSVIIMSLDRNDRSASSRRKFPDLEMIWPFMRFHADLFELSGGHANAVAFLDSQRAKPGDSRTAGNERRDCDQGQCGVGHAHLVGR